LFHEAHCYASTDTVVIKTDGLTKPQRAPALYKISPCRDTLAARLGLLEWFAGLLHTKAGLSPEVALHRGEDEAGLNWMDRIGIMV
jgi:hypothetical protein